MCVASNRLNFGSVDEKERDSKRKRAEGNERKMQEYRKIISDCARCMISTFNRNSIDRHVFDTGRANKPGRRGRLEFRLDGKLS